MVFLPPSGNAALEGLCLWCLGLLMDDFRVQKTAQSFKIKGLADPLPGGVK
jgi:hypothetical protein